MAKYKLIKLSPGMTWPKYGVYDDIAYKEDMVDFLESTCLTGTYANNPELFKEERGIGSAGTLLTEEDGEYWCVVLDEEPEKNEFGVVSP